MGVTTMGKTQLKEQKAFHGHQTYTYRSSSALDVDSTPTRRPQGIERARTRTRTVRTPKHVQPATWNTLADRRAQLRRLHTKPRTYTAPVPRTFAQTGMSASNGRMRAIPRPQSQPNIPIRRSPSDHTQHRRNKGFFAKLLAFLAVLVISIFALTSPTFHIQQVHVVGTKNPILISNLQHMGIQGQNIFLIDTNALTARIDTSPMVTTATINKQWPNQLTVTVAERIPALLWQTPNALYSVDSQGIVIAPAQIGANHLMTVIDTSNTSGQPIHPGIRLNQADIAFALQIFTHLPQVTGITTFTLRYTATDLAGVPGSYIVESPDDWQAYLGNTNDTNPLDNRLIELKQILALAQAQQLNLATIDLRFGLRPIYTLKNS